MALTTPEAMLASTGANILAGAFGGGQGGNIRNQKDAIRTQWKYGEPNRRASSQWDLENIYGKSIQTRVKDAKAAGIHPLFAMGSQGASGQSVQSAIPGQSGTGSFAKDALQAIGGGFASIAQIQAQTDLVEKMAELEALQQADRELSNDTTYPIDVRRRSFTPKKSSQERAATTPLTEFKKGEVGAYNPKAPSENMNVLSPMTTVRIGSQLVKVPVEEAADFMEDPLAAGLATYMYHGNNHVDWGLLAREYMHGIRKRGIKRNASPPPVIPRSKPAPNKAFRGHGYRPKTWR